ncbi:MAG: type IV toxin-antitoxin system AbiEi family antitoxin [Deltaproteobacteria bacterium]|nr:type IV toxin-antitoxin system AbiEi family antitoxin [Deltaproteobacteria bacterium]
MKGRNKNKLNQLLQKISQQCVVTQPWLSKNGIYRQLADVYYRSGWLEKIGRGAFARVSDDVSWTGGLCAIQQQMGLPIHVGGKTALQRQGLAHFLPLKEGDVTLFGAPCVKLPRWFIMYNWGTDIHYVALRLFDPNIRRGFTTEDLGTYTITISSPERAIMEVLHFVPEDESFETARLLMEGLTTLRPKLVQTLLEKCRSVKVARLFMFLAEECKHEWVNQLDLNQVNFGKGKRVIVKGGRLDPIYNITVPCEPFVDSRRQMRILQNKRKRSVAIRLMCPEKDIQLTYGREHGYFGSMLYLAFENEQLLILDQLLKKFNIEKRGSKDFRNRLKENWLRHVPEHDLKRQRRASNNTLAALIELVVAQRLRQEGARILDLEAWGNKSPDIDYQEADKRWNVEVKYIGQSPEDLELSVKQLKTDIPEIRRHDDSSFINYYYGRIAEAAMQLSHYPYDTRQVWIVFDELSSRRKMFERNYLHHPCDWFGNTDEQKNILDMFDPGIYEKKPSEWLKEVSEIILATFTPWHLEDIKRYRTKELEA